MISPKAEDIIEQFKTLPKVEQWGVYEAIARTVVPEDYGELSDEELTASDAQSFAMLDEEESRRNSR